MLCSWCITRRYEQHGYGDWLYLDLEESLAKTARLELRRKEASAAMRSLFLDAVRCEKSVVVATVDIMDASMASCQIQHFGAERLSTNLIDPSISPLEKRC